MPFDFRRTGRADLNGVPGAGGGAGTEVSGVGAGLSVSGNVVSAGRYGLVLLLVITGGLIAFAYWTRK